MNGYGTLHEIGGRYVLEFERFFTLEPVEVFHAITDPALFSQWYPFATGEIDQKPDGKIGFDDGEGTKYQGIVTDFEPPRLFAFREIDDLVDIEVLAVEEGNRLVFRHTFDDRSMAVMTAAGWHRCLDALGMLIQNQEVEWPDNAANLREVYSGAFGSA